MVPPLLYANTMSPPCRAVLLAAKAAGIDIDMKETRLMRGDHLKEEFLKLNPQHTIPTMDDNGFVITDSHAIVTYLIDKYAKDNSLYPKDVEKRSLINQFLHFNNSVLFASVKGITFPLFFDRARKVPQDRLDRLIISCEFLEKYLGNNDWLVGDSYTLADISVVSVVSSLPVFLSLDKFPKIAAWLKRCEVNIPGYPTVNVPGCNMLMNTIRGRLQNQ